jgi:hypothetical protein
MKYIIQKTDDEGIKTYFSVGTTRWTTDKKLAKTFEVEHTAKMTALSLNTYYELEVIEYGK